jgi:hypothetical protein
MGLPYQPNPANVLDIDSRIDDCLLRHLFESSNKTLPPALNLSSPEHHGRELTEIRL